VSFRVAHDHKAAGRDTTLSMPSSTRREDPTAMTRHRSHSLLSLAVVSVLVSLVMNYIVIELILLDMCDELYCHKLVFLVMNYIVHSNEYLFWRHPGQGGSQKRQW
jgi:hypothetical protein